MINATTLDDDRCYRAAESRDARFDGWFYVAVRSTGIYCRPSCPAVTPKRRNVEFHPTAAAAQQHGFRACKRCRPDAAPGSPEWNVRGDVVARAMRLIGDGVVDRDGVGGLADRLGYSERHLHRMLVDELGAGPLALARAQRAQTARTLIETTDLTMTDVAFASGFGSVRQFNDTVREVFASSPSDLRTARGRPGRGAAGAVSVRLPVRTPFAGRQLLWFIGAHAVPGVEWYDDGHYARTLDLPHGHGTVDIELGGDAEVRAEFRLADWRDLAPAVGRVRRLLDLDADPVAIDGALSADPVLAPLVAACPGRRVHGAVDPFESLIRTIIGQQVSVAGASRVTGRVVEATGDELTVDHPVLRFVFPSPDRLATAPAEVFPMPTARGATVRRAAAAVVAGDVTLDDAVDRHELVDQLCSLKGIGPWTAQHLVMRGFGDPDIMLTTDLVVRRALEQHGLTAADTERWRPWRSYAMHHLWSTLFEEDIS